MFVKLDGFATDQLYTLHTLLVQALIMEEDGVLKGLLRSNLESVITSICRKEKQNYVNNYLDKYLLVPKRF